ncbi:MAG: DUF1961 family protein, partial [Gemmatimonadota bacterium]|nr:DUF1961 family protein [Gemmatimonadota bacterium]
LNPEFPMLKTMHVIFLMLLIPGVLPAQEPASASGKLWQKGELLAKEDFSSGLGDWQAEGDITARIEDGRLRFEATTLTDIKKGNIWLKKDFTGPVLIEYDYQSATIHGLSMVWWNTQGRGGEDLFSFERSGAYIEYVKGKMNGYHISYHRFSTGLSNLRKSYGFHLLSSETDPVQAEDLKVHHIVIYCQGGHIRFEVDGRVVHDYIDKGQPCIGNSDWVHETPCQGTGPALTKGKLGLRHTQKQVAYYDNFKVYRLVEP